MASRFGSIACILALWVGTAGCARTPPEQALRETVAELEAAVGERDAAAVEAQLAEDFIGPDGLDKTGARRLAQALFFRYRSTGATLGPLEIALQDRHATVRFTAALTAGAGGLLPESGQVYEVETGWRLEDDEWRLVSAQWKERL
ncbi:nuclear transport factor 2 family protein [Lysobacter sp. CFH 32150]|uniref:nuclear transport factor 2 family protein n=1 Tax=Lysobacter sp. CFH 32150 TaxID=2927128 RepID=UPI001FA6DC7A|nr:nuclear transport factor 2 family protein [Lysobacter sp. CFH 32150]MCI4567031.1 nuclear transport factor 2 family protein [Lysobacter sp. CFH 32150]